MGYSPWGCKEHGGSTEHIINLWKINLEYRMGFIIRKSELKSVFQNLLGIKMRFFKYEKSRTICFIYTIMKHTFKPFLREYLFFIFKNFLVLATQHSRILVSPTRDQIGAHCSGSIKS